MRDQYGPHAACLPHDVLVEIFSHYLHNAQNAKKPVLHKVRVGPSLNGSPDTPVLLSHVCSHWRAVALHAPALWARVGLALDYPHTGDLETFKLYLERSCTHPIDITIEPGATLFNRFQYKAKPQVVPLIEATFCQLNRWKRVKLVAQAAWVLAAHPPVDIEVPELEFLHIAFCDSSFERKREAARELFRTFARFPQLKGLSLPEWSLGADWASKINWDALTEVSITARIKPGDLDIFRRCKQAQSLSVTFPLLRQDQPFPPINYTTLPLLRHLSIMAVAEWHFLPFWLDRLTLPSLAKATLSGPQCLRACPSLAALVARSCCTLEALCIKNELTQILPGPAAAPETQLAHSSFSSLRILELDLPVSDEFFTQMTLEPLLPHLQTLVLSRCMSTDGVLSSMLVSRAHSPGCKLRDVSVKFTTPAPKGLVIDGSLQIPGINLIIERPESVLQ